MIRTWRRHGITALAVLCLLAPAQAKKPPPAGPDATQVMVRGRVLVDALEIACQPAGADPKKLRPVVLIFDVTENVKAATDRVGKALVELATRECKAKGWRLARLGAKPGKASAKLTQLPKRIPYVLSKGLTGKSTIGMLRKTVKSVPKNAVLVYLADWQFEDDCELEELIVELQRKKATFSVLGSESAFGHAWDDGIKGPDDLLNRNDGRGGFGLHFGDIGRNPFQSTHVAPWHGGESAIPGIPYRWSWGHWKTAFDDYDWSIAGLGHDKREGEKTHTERSLPSGFGPYGLMRAAGVTGGRYALVGWTSGGRRNVRYDYARCNLLAPDLRARDDVRADLQRNRFLRATIAAWHILLEAGDDLIKITPPLEANLKTPRTIDRVVYPGGLGYIWKEKSDYEAFVQAAPEAVKTLDRAIQRLDQALQGDDSPADLRRYEADARLMAHICRVARFETAECIEAAKDLPKNLWKRGTRPGILLRDWVKPGRDPDKPNLRAQAKPWNQKTADVLLAERNELLRRFRGTPWGELLAMNDIETAQPNWWKKPRGGSSGSGRRTRPDVPSTRPGGGSSTGGGPTTGGG